MDRFAKISEVGLPNGIVSGLGVTIDGLTVTVTAGSWRINNEVYSKATDTTFELSEADLTNNRYDLIRADASGIHLTEGDTALVAPKPALPADNILIDYVLISPSGISTAGGSLAGYVTKEEFSNTVGDKTTLATDNKNDVVSAVNELDQEISGINADNITLSIFKVSNYATL